MDSLDVEADLALLLSEGEEEVVEKRAKVEEIIEEYVGGFGYAQALHVFLVSLAWFFDSQHTLVTIFTDAQPSWRCFSANTTSCSICEMDRSSWEWVGGKHTSIIAEWDLVCQNKFKAGLPASIFFIGSFLGSPVLGRMADSHLGRKGTLMVSCLLTAITGFLTAMSPNFWTYVLLRFANGFWRSGLGMSCLVLSTEAVGRKWRGQVGQYGFFLFTAGFLALPPLAYTSRSSWRDTYVFISIPPLLYCAAILPLVSESPRWLALKGRTHQAMEVLSSMARLNGNKLPPHIAICTKPHSKESHEGSSQNSLWSAGWARRRILLVMAAGLGIGFVYYGIQLNVENLKLNLYVTVAVNAIMEIPAVFLGSVLLTCMDRRIVVASCAAFSGVSCIMCTVLKGKWSKMMAESVGFMTISTGFDVMYIYSVELFPTNVRNQAVSMLRQALMTGAALSPVVVTTGRIHSWLSFMVFGVVGIVSGLLTLTTLPETRNRPLYETLEQQEHAEMEMQMQPHSPFVIA